MQLRVERMARSKAVALCNEVGDERLALRVARPQEMEQVSVR